MIETIVIGFVIAWVVCMFIQGFFSFLDNLGEKKRIKIAENLANELRSLK